MCAADPIAHMPEARSTQITANRNVSLGPFSLPASKVCFPSAIAESIKTRSAQNNRRRVAFAWEGQFPFYIVRFAPIERRLGMGPYTRGERAPPLGPEFLGSGISDGVCCNAYHEG